MINVLQNLEDKSGEHGETGGGSTARPSRQDNRHNFAAIDLASAASEKHFEERERELDRKIEALTEAAQEKRTENEKIAAEVRDSQKEMEAKREEAESLEKILFELNGNRRVEKTVRKKHQLMMKIKEQHELMENLQSQLNTYMYKSFPSLG